MSRERIFLGVNERKDVYRRKLAVVSECLGRIPADLGGVSRLELDGVLHNFQVMIDACMGLAAMVVKDAGHTVGDDYENLEKMEEIGLIQKPMVEELFRLNGLRNAIVHRYNSFEEEVVLQGMDTIQSMVLGFAEAVEGGL